MQNATFALAGLSILLLIIVVAYKRKYDGLREMLEDERFRQRSLSTTYGKISEQWFPLMDRYPYDAQGFRFLGSPIDGIQFEEDRIVFCEFKANRSDLTPEQRRIRKLVESGRVYWEEFYFVEE
jgi:Predicted secreted endonuclease distantly related to archaeal Holliday junction resolvase